MRKNDAGGIGAALAMVGIVVAIIAIPIGVWVIRVATSDVAGRGNAVVKVNDADNRLAQQAYFEQTYADIQSSDRKLDSLASAAKANPSDRDAATRLTGAENYCQSLVGDYDAAARKEVAAKFKAADLPARIDLNDTPTDCKPGS